MLLSRETSMTRCLLEGGRPHEARPTTAKHFKVGENSLLIRTRIPFVLPLSGWLLIAALIVCGVKDLGFGSGIAGALLVIASLIVHELAHVLAAFVLKVRVYEIGIKFIGAYTRRRYANSRLEEVAISAAGPSASLVLFFVLFFIPGIGPWLAAWNLGITVLNLAPLPGTDGHRILKTIFWPASFGHAKVAELLGVPQ